MPRKAVPFSNIFPLHINARAHNREAFKAPMDEIWLIMENYLFVISSIFEIKIHSFVLMPNHFHLIFLPTENNVGAALNYFMRETSKEIGLISHRINQVYGGRNYKTLITNERYYLTAYKYVYRNPVKAKLCNRVEDYRYSTLSSLMGNTKSFIPLEEDTLLFSPNFSERTLLWLNEEPLKKDYEDATKAMRRSIFTLPLDKDSKKLSRLETELF
ncbi:MAG: transposase [Oligoflexia bacterium]|nr:transposase [Oligoflexia bacterium]